MSKAESQMLLSPLQKVDASVNSTSRLSSRENFTKNFKRRDLYNYIVYLTNV